jgi:hypothetical protein
MHAMRARHRSISRTLPRAEGLERFITLMRMRVQHPRDVFVVLATSQGPLAGALLDQQFHPPLPVVEAKLRVLVPISARRCRIAGSLTRFATIISS